jgi:glycerophosphoryl diester phosphodiesterase
MTSLNILNNIKIGGHRGMGCTDHPFTLKRPQPDTSPTENTAQSVKQALQKGCDFVEVDVVLTKDNAPIASTMLFQRITSLIKFLINLLIY